MNEMSTAINPTADDTDFASTHVGNEPETPHGGWTIDLETPLAKRLPAKQPRLATDERGSSSAVAVGRVLRDRYVLEKRLGSGGMGTVFKALDRYRSDLPEANQYVAIKILHQRTDNRQELLDNLRREFYCTQMLSHRNIVKVYELDRDGDVDFFTMELLEGELLNGVTERLHPLAMPRPYAWAIIREIGAGIAHAHARNVIHTDLKPHNIMITNSGEIRILDFGASSTSLTQGPDVLSRRNALSAITPAYACCELLAGRSADPRDDIYAFACIAYELLAGSHPFQRRPSTVARDLGVVPQRPPGLTGRQWKTLMMGLSWHRAARSIAVRAWLNKLHANRAAAKQLPRARDLEPAPAGRGAAGSLRAATVFAVFLISVAAAVSIMRVSQAGKINGEHIASAVTANRGLEPQTSGLNLTSADGNPPAIAPSVALVAPNAAPNEKPSGGADTASQLAINMKHDEFRPRPQAALLNPIVVSARNYRIRSGEKFAEIRVHRASQSHRDAAFVWWTEAASAKPGIDYVHQGKVTQTISKGRDTATFFIKLVPSASRTQREVFYVAIAEPGPGASPGPVARTAVWLPTTHDHS
jgi:serine/threonine protein kinase